MTMRKARMDALGIVILVGFGVLLGLNQSLVKLVNAGFSPLFQGGLRSACAFLPVLAFALIVRRRFDFSPGALGWGALNGLFFTAEFGLLFIALDFSTVARVSLFFYMMPVWVAVAAHFLIPEEPLHRNKVFGLALSVAGIAVGFSSHPGGTAGDLSWLGDILALAGGVCWAGIALVTRLKLPTCSSEQNLLFQLAVSGVILTLAALASGDVVREPDLATYGIFAFQVIVIVCIGFLLWFWVLSIYPVSNMTSFSLLTPISGVFFGWLVFGDPLTPAFVAALAMAGAGIVLINRPVPPPVAADGTPS